jgi:hypothetical protein
VSVAAADDGDLSDPADVATVESPEAAQLAPSAGATIASVVREAVRTELDEVLPHVVTALKRHDAATDLAQRLDAAEKRIAERNARPLVAGIRRSLNMVRQLNFDAEVKSAIVGDLERMLIGAGYTEFGEIGEPFDPSRHEVISGEAGVESVVVLEIFEPGVETLGETVAPARVRVGDLQQQEARK